MWRCGLLLLAWPVLALSLDSALPTAPLLLWSNKAIVGHGNGQQVSYEVVKATADYTTGLVMGGLGRTESSKGQLVHAKQSGEATVVVYVGSQLGTADLRKPSNNGAFSKLSGILSSAASSLALPYAQSEGKLMQQQLVENLEQLSSVRSKVVGCSSSGSTDIATQVADALAEGVYQVLVVCSQVGKSAEGTAAGLQSELDQLAAVQAAVTASGIDHLFLYVSAPAAQRPQPRSLLAAYTGFGQYQACDLLCQTQVRWLEAMFALTTLALAACSGLVCLYILDTPTKFEAPKESQ